MILLHIQFSHTYMGTSVCTCMYTHMTFMFTQFSDSVLLHCSVSPGECHRARSKEITHLPFFVKSHDHHSGSKLLNFPSLRQEVILSLLQANAVDNAFSLAAFQASFNHGEIGRVNAQGHLHQRGRKNHRKIASHHGLPSMSWHPNSPYFICRE